MWRIKHIEIGRKPQRLKTNKSQHSPSWPWIGIASLTGIWTIIQPNIHARSIVLSWSQWSHGLRRRSVAVRLLRLWVRIPPRAWKSVCCEYCVLSGRGLCDELITRPEEFYRLWCVVVCDLENSWMRRPWPTGGCRAKNKQTNKKSVILNPWKIDVMDLKNSPILQPLWTKSTRPKRLLLASLFRLYGSHPGVFITK